LRRFGSADKLGVQLMVRGTGSVRLTPTGASFAAEVRTALERLAQATSNATGQSSRILSVSAIDSFAARWLTPRLHPFRQAHGDIDVRVAVSATLADFVDDGIDIAIHRNCFSSVCDQRRPGSGREDRDGKIGTGMGLSNVKRLVHRLGGEISMQSRVGLGSTVWFTVVKNWPDVAPAGSRTTASSRL
jgi:Histidine kinase-, DNA gyrase B-, and HSP90-like ATPase/LysR substrate binding domain